MWVSKIEMKKDPHPHPVKARVKLLPFFKVS